MDDGGGSKVKKNEEVGPPTAGNRCTCSIYAGCVNIQMKSPRLRVLATRNRFGSSSMVTREIADPYPTNEKARIFGYRIGYVSRSRTIARRRAYPVWTFEGVWTWMKSHDAWFSLLPARDKSERVFARVPCIFTESTTRTRFMSLACRNVWRKSIVEVIFRNFTVSARSYN